MMWAVIPEHRLWGALGRVAKLFATLPTLLGVFGCELETTDGTKESLDREDVV